MAHPRPENVSKLLNNSDIRTITDTRNEKIGRKIRDNELKRIPFMLIVGEKEQAEGVVSLRVQGEGDQGQMTPKEFAQFVAARVAKEIEPINN